MSDQEAEAQSATPSLTPVAQIPVNLPLPAQLSLTGNLATNWKRFQRAWKNYEIAARLKDPSNSTLNKELRTATLLTCIGSDALDVYDAFVFETPEQGKDIDIVLEKFEQYCIGETNETYERYRFNKCDQKEHETIDAYVTSLRTLAKTCNFGQLENDLIRDRIVMGIRDNTTRKKLLQVAKLSLSQCIDVSRSYEKTSQQLESMKSNEVQAFNKVLPQSTPTSKQKTGEQNLIRCKFCATTHTRDKFQCPAWGKTCSVFRSNRRMVSSIDHDTDSSEEYIATLTMKQIVSEVYLEENDPKPHASMKINGRLETFLLDSGATVNVLSKKTLEELFSKNVVRKIEETNATLVMYNGSEIKPIGKVRLQVINPKNLKKYSVEFMIVKENCNSVLGARASQQMKLLQVISANIFEVKNKPNTVPVCQQPLSKEWLTTQYPEVFEGVGTLPDILHLEIDNSVPPVQLPVRRIPLAVRDKLKHEIDRLVELKVITPVDSPTDWISATVVTIKKDGTIRLCIDPKPLNKALKRNHYPLLTIDDILPDLPGARCFSVLDAKSGYWHVELDEPSSFATTFGTPWGRYRWLRMPFGLSPAPEEFQRRMNSVLHDLPGVKVIADDILVFGKGATDAEAFADHDRNLKLLMDRCQSKGLKLNSKKLQLRLSEVAYMGHLITSDGLRVDPEKTKAIREMPVPSDKAGVQRLLGMVNYVQKFAPNLADITSPLRDLVKKDNEFIWDDQVHGHALDQVRQILSQPPLLKFFDPKVTPVLQCDASMHGLGACLLQNNQPVAYASRSLTQTEIHYAQIEKEMLAIVFGMEKFETYLYGRKVFVESDHKPLEAILKKSLLNAPKRLQRMMLRLQHFDFEVQYKQGPLMFLADTLSRATTPMGKTDETIGTSHVMQLHSIRSTTEIEVEEIDMLRNLSVKDTTVSQIRQATEADSVLRELKTVIKNGWPCKRSDVSPVLHPYHPFRDELVEQNGVIFKGERLLVPPTMRHSMIERLHFNHAGVQATLRRARDVFYWPRMNRDIEKCVASCGVCSRYQSAPPKEPLKSYPIPARPWQYIGTDLCQLHGKDYLVTVDYYSNSAVQTPGFSPPAPAPAPAKKTPAPGKKLRLRQKTCEN